MKRILFVIVSVLFGIVFSSYTNIIAEHTLSLFTPSDTEVVEIIPIKMLCGQNEEGFCIIKNDRERRTLTRCTRFDIPTIDYNTYTLIGIYHTASGCAAKDTVYVLKTTNVITIHHDITEYGFCEPLRHFDHWFLLKKEPNYEIKTEFNLRHQ